ncbi:MAG: esterase-like activity of phytase family protein [Chthoniobacterales bacterium]
MRWAIFFAVSLIFPALLYAGGEVEAYGTLPANAVDARGDTIGGIGSGICYDRKIDRYFCVSDRGPGNGAFSYRPRFVIAKISPDPTALRKLRVDVEKVVILKDENGKEMTGINPSSDPTDHPVTPAGVTCIDPEAIAVAPDGTVYVTDEYGPYLYQFSRDGKMLRRLRAPDYYTPIDSNGKVNFSASADVISGRRVNLGFEGLTLISGGKVAVLLLEKPLAQDGRQNSIYTRMLFMDLSSGKIKAEYAYAFESAESIIQRFGKPGDKPTVQTALSVNEIAALDDNRFFVIERDKSGENGSLHAPPARYKAVWLVDIRGATNLMDSAFAPYRLQKTKEGSKSLARAVDLKAVRKQLLFNLPSLKFDFGKHGPSAETLGAKWEGLAYLRSPSENVFEMMLTNDNDFLTPKIHDNGQVTPFPLARKPQDMFFLKIKARLMPHTATVKIDSKKEGEKSSFPFPPKVQ